MSLDSEEHLTNRLEELNSLALALSTCLDNLAEEVSVCHGLLLMGGGASALAAHVRSLKEQLSQRKDEVEECSEKWQRAENLLVLWKRRVGKDASADVDALVVPNPVSNRSLSISKDAVQLRAQIGATENKVRKLRASITDMSEESEKALKEVDKRGLSGGITLVRKLREELRELEFQLSEAKSGEGICRAKIQRLQARLTHPGQSESSSTLIKAPTLPEMNRESEEQVFETPPPYRQPFDEAMKKPLGQPPVDTTEKEDDVVVRSLDLGNIDSIPPKDSEDPGDPLQPASNGIREESDTVPHSYKVATGESNAIMIRQSSNYIPLDIWQLLLRIIGLGQTAVKTNVKQMKESTTHVMIV